MKNIYIIPIFHNKIPIYVDGMVKIPECNKKLRSINYLFIFKKVLKYLKRSMNLDPWEKLLQMT